MISYRSTRGDRQTYAYSEAILKGIATDGGLLVPSRIPSLSLQELRNLSNTSYQERALFVFKRFEIDFPPELLTRLVNQAYAANFDHRKIAPLVELKDNQYILELWHGPTSSFKDMALQVMPLFFSEAIKRGPRQERPLHYLILVATSGDTGKAALEGYKDKDRLSIIVFYPRNRVSQLQELQMGTQEGENLAVYALRGNFDDVQKYIKETFAAEEFNAVLLEKYDTVLSSANSVNWGRLLPQMAYYISSYTDLVDRRDILLGDKIDIAVPTGNFGNILAAFYAKRMGLPIRKLICASNANNVLTEFLQTGTYDITKRTLLHTPSPSMDILIASNIERLLSAIVDDAPRVGLWMRELRTRGQFEVDNQTREVLRQEFYADWVADDECLSNIKKIHNTTAYLMDPHTSVAQAVVDNYWQKIPDRVPVTICATAHWAKFAGDVYKALTNSQAKSNLGEFETLDAISRLITTASIPENISVLRSKTIRHTAQCDPSTKAVETKILDYLTSRRV